jgi:hypothetical protein
VLLGTGTNSLGTNNITVGVDGALETTYNINSPKATLQLNGRMYLHQDDVFGSVTVGTTALAKGTYTFEELNAQFPNNFPATWTAKLGAVDVNGTPYETGSGSITVANDNTTPVTVTTPLPTTTQVQANSAARLMIAVSGPVTAVTWYSNNVVVATGVDLSYTSPVLDASANNSIYNVVVENTVNKVTNSTAIQIITTPLNITFPGSIQQPIPDSWETPGQWSDGNPVSVSAAANPQNTYEVLPGARLRSPDGQTNAVFAGSVLKIDGNSVWNLAPAANGPLAELRFKQGNTVDENGAATGYGYVTFPNLVLNGGQLDVGNDGTIVIAGHVDVAKKSIFSVNAAANRGYRIDAQLSGTNEIEVHLSSTATFNDAEAHNLNVASTNNPFSGTWNIVTGTLLGTAPGALGTNDINIGANGALLTTYDINNPKGSLNLQGRMYLTQNDTFRTVTVGTTRLAAGTYTYEELAASYPEFFPGFWTPMIGAEEVLTPSGSITVLEDNFLPTVTITSPAAGTAYPGQPTYYANAPTNITLTADATIERGTITKVEYFEGATKIGEATAAPYTVTWNNVQVGPHTITAKVSAANGQSATTKARIIVGTPFVSVNFQNEATTTPEGYLADLGDVYGDRGNGQTYGWDVDNTANDRQRNSANSPDIRYDTFNHMQKPQPAGSVWEIAVPNGTYLVTGAAGDADNSDSLFDVQAEGVTFISGTPSTDASARFVEGSATVTVTDGRLTISNGPTAVNNKIDFLDIFQAAGGPTPTSPSMKNATVSGGAFNFAFTSQSGVTYRVQYKDALDDATWQTLETKTGTGSDINVSYALTPTMRFFRIITP